MSDGLGDEKGYGKPPKSSQFKKGKSGNPRGRPRGHRRLAPYEAVLGQKVTVRDNGAERVVTAAEAFLLKISNEGLQGDASAVRVVLPAIEAAAGERAREQSGSVDEIIIVPVAPGSVNIALRPLRMAQKLDPYRETARILLEPWIVEKALLRLGSRRLNLDEQKAVLAATRTPKKVKWPDWWDVLPN